MTNAERQRRRRARLRAPPREILVELLPTGIREIRGSLCDLLVALSEHERRGRKLAAAFDLVKIWQRMKEVQPEMTEQDFEEEMNLIRKVGIAKIKAAPRRRRSDCRRS